MRGKNRYQTPFIENVVDENVCGTPVDTQHRGGSEETDVLSPSSCSLPSPLVEIEWSTGQCSSTEVTFASKADEIRRKCRNSLLEKTPKILIERLKKEGFLLLRNLTVLEVRLVNHNPSVFNVYIDMDMPRCPVAKVRMVQEVDPEQLDLTGKSGNLRHAFDEEFADLTTSKLFFSRTREAVRKCAVMAFVPPRCFILCDEKGTQDEERLKSISESLEDSLRNIPPVRDSSITPGEFLVGVRTGVYMRVAVLQGDVQQERIRCICLDYNAIYSFGSGELFPLCDEFSVDEVPTNVFLARIRGTHYVYSIGDHDKYALMIQAGALGAWHGRRYQAKHDMYEAANNEVCKSANSGGVVPFLTCAIYGRAPDLLTIVDVCMSVEDGWVSERLIDLNIAAPFQPDPCVKITPYEAEEMLKDRIRREVARMIASDSPDLERSEYRVRNPKKSGTCVRCGCETTAGKELRRRRGDPYSNLPEAVSPSKSSDGDHSEKSTSDVDYHRAGSVTEQLMSVARKMHAKNEQQGNDLSDAQERNWLWTPQPDRATRSSQESNESQMTRPSLSSPNLPLASETAPKSGNFASSVGGDGCEGDDEKSDACSTGEIKKLSKKIDHCSPENEPISRIRPWKLEDDEGLSTSAKAPNAESESGERSAATGKEIAVPIESRRSSSSGAERPPVSQRPIARIVWDSHSESESANSGKCEIKGSARGSISVCMKSKKTPPKIDYLSKENNREFEMNPPIEARTTRKLSIPGHSTSAQSASGTVRSASAESEESSALNGFESSERAVLSTSSRAQRLTSEIVCDSGRVSQSGEHEGKQDITESISVETDEETWTAATSETGTLANVAENKATAETEFTKCPARAAQMRQVFQNKGSKSVTGYDGIKLDKAHENEQENGQLRAWEKQAARTTSIPDQPPTGKSATCLVGESANIASRTEFKRFSAPMTSSVSSSEREDSDDEYALNRVFELYKAARCCSKKVSSRKEDMDLFVTMAMANAGRLLIEDPETEEEKRIAKEFLSLSDTKSWFAHV